MQFGIELAGLLKIPRAASVLLDLLSNRNVRVGCADTLSRLEPRGKATRVFIDIGNRELASPCPDRRWLEAVVFGLQGSSDQRAVEMLVTILERSDLAGWLRGDAADKLGFAVHLMDRRTRLYRRCRDAALRAFHEESIYAKFGGMYLIGSLCTQEGRKPVLNLREFKAALPQLRRVAKNDQRLAPGFWWPMSAEAEDVIACIQTGRWPDPEAAERWQGNTARGVWNRD